MRNKALLTTFVVVSAAFLNDAHAYSQEEVNAFDGVERTSVSSDAGRAKSSDAVVDTQAKTSRATSASSDEWRASIQTFKHH